MQIRAITIGLQQRPTPDLASLRRAAEFGNAARDAFEQQGLVVQSVRLAAQPISQVIPSGSPNAAVAYARAMDRAIADSGIDYCSLGPALASAPGREHGLIDAIDPILRETDRSFVSVMAATLRDGVNLGSVWRTAGALVAMAKGDAQATRARRFTVSALVPPHGPFFPSAYHRGARMGFSLAMEAADLAVEAFTEAATIDLAQSRLIDAMETACGPVQRLGEELERRYGVRFWGMDISLAPFPDAARSIAGAFERLGVDIFGAHGTLFATALTTDALRRVRVRTCGFSGLMLPLIEDSVMAERHRQGRYDIIDLLLYSSVCGAGLDTVPLPGNTTQSQIASVYLDLCTLALKLRKPLTVRLMPMPGKAAGDPVEFDFPYFAPTTVVALGAASNRGLFDKGSWNPHSGSA